MDGSSQFLARRPHDPRTAFTEAVLAWRQHGVGGNIQADCASQGIRHKLRIENFLHRYSALAL